MHRIVKIWVVVIHHKHGTDVDIAASADTAEEIVAKWARENWDAVTGFSELFAAEEYEEQYGREEMIQRYFESENAFGGSEYADITQHELTVSDGV